MIDLSVQRRFFAEEIQAVSNLQTTAVVEALASVPREQFLPPGPWMIRGEGEFQGGPRPTPDADPRHLYHNLAVAIDPRRMLFNGAPGVLATTIDALRLAPGDRVMHLGAGLGYYTAILAHCVGPSGRVVAFEIDPLLAADAARHLAPMPWVEVRTANGAGPFDETFDAMLINAGVTHLPDAWLDALSSAGRIVAPFTVQMAPAMPTIGKGPMILVSRTANAQTLAARIVTFVAIYSALDLRDEAAGRDIAAAMQGNPFAPLASLRRDPHARTDTCWVHGPTTCLSLRAPA